LYLLPEQELRPPTAEEPTLLTFPSTTRLDRACQQNSKEKTENNIFSNQPFIMAQPDAHLDIGEIVRTVSGC
jgi:hypothetical protein